MTRHHSPLLPLLWSLQRIISKRNTSTATDNTDKDRTTFPTIPGVHRNILTYHLYTHTSNTMYTIMDVTSTPTFHDRITKIEVHAYNPYANTTFDNNDEIRIQYQDLYTLPCESYLYVKGCVSLMAATTTVADVKATARVFLDNNCVAFMFDEIRYELDGLEKDRSRNPGISTALKHYASLSVDRSKALMNAGWDHSIAHDKDIFNTATFNFCVPMNTLLRFCEDYRRIVMNTRHELILIRARLDTNTMYAASLNSAILPKLTINKI